MTNPELIIRSEEILDKMIEHLERAVPFSEEWDKLQEQGLEDAYDALPEEEQVRLDAKADKLNRLIEAIEK